MERTRVDPQEIARQLEEDFNAAQNMIGEGAPDYSAVEEDDAPEELKREEKKAKDLH